MRYYVYDAVDTKSYAMVHEETCPHARPGNPHWYGPLETKVAARRKARETGRLEIRCCQVCSP